MPPIDERSQPPPAGPAVALSPAARAAASDILRGSVEMALSMALFGAMAVLARVAGRQMGAGQLVVVRFAVMFAAMVALWASQRVEIRPRNMRLLVLRGVFGGAAVLLYFVALRRCRDAGTAALLNCTSPMFTSAFAWWLLGERPGARLGLAFVLASLGVGLVLWTPHLGGLQLGWGEVAGLFSGLLSGAAVTAIRAARSTDNSATILLAFTLGGFLIAAPFALYDWYPADASTWWLAVAVGLVSLVAQLTMTHAFGLLSASHGALIQQLVPVFTFGLGAFFLGEPVGWHAAVGGALALGAVAWAAGPRRAQVAPAPA